MKKMVMFILSLIICGNIFGQSVEYRKPVVLIDFFKGTGDVDKETTESFRMSYVTNAKKKTDRIQFVDASTEDLLSEEQKRRMRDDALDDVLAKEMVQLNVDYILTATINSAKIEREKDKEGKDSYTGELAYSVNIVATEDGSVIYTEEDVITSFSKETSKDAETGLLNNAVVTCGVVEAIAHLKGEMIETDYVTDKKGKKMEKCYINLGEVHGVKKGDDFIVMAATSFIAGRLPKYEKVGELEITEVLAEDLSECKIKKNGEDVLKYMKEYLLAKTSDSGNAAILQIESDCKKSSDEVEADIDKGLKKAKDAAKVIEGIFKLF